MLTGKKKFTLCTTYELPLLSLVIIMANYIWLVNGVNEICCIYGHICFYSSTVCAIIKIAVLIV